MRELPSGSVTFLFSDIEGSTKLLHELGPDAYADALDEHRRLIRAAFAAHGGVEVDTQGDAFFVAFSDASGALAAAGQAQAALAEGPIRVRIGLHTGTPLVTAEGYVGIDVHRGARVMSAGHGGQVLVSEATYELLDGRSGLTDLGLHRLKDLTEPQRLWQLGDGEFPPLKTLYQTNLPVQPTPLVGREAELAQVLELLEQSRLVTLTGAGGSGKTRLALQAAAELVDEFADGVWWVSLATLRDPELVEATIAQVVGAKDGLADHLSGKQALLLLDNFEQLLEAAPRISAFLGEAPDVRVLVTSRERLRLAAEQEYAVPTMVPGEAVALFTARARQLKLDFEPDEATEEICRRLDGLPLAIELAAARIKVLRPDQILERVAHSLDLLTAGARDAPERQQTLRATIEWSYELLSEEEQALFARLAVFAGSFDLESAQAVCDAEVDTLAALIDRSLLRQAAGRYSLLETIREYGRDRLGHSSEADTLGRRHAAYFLELAEEAEPQLRGAEEGRWLDRIEGEYDNLRAALEWLHAAQDDEETLRLTGALSDFWLLRGYSSEGRRHLQLALERAGSGASRAKALYGAIDLAQLQGDYTSAATLAEERLALCRSLGDAAGESDSLRNIADTAKVAGNYEAAAAAYEESVAVARRAGNVLVLARALGNFGDLALYRGELGQARELFNENHLLFEQVEGQDGIALSLLNLGVVELLEGRDEDALARFEACLRLSHEIGWKEGSWMALEGIGWARAPSDAEPAARIFGSAAAFSEEYQFAQPPLERRLHDEAVARLRAELGDEAFETAFAMGSTLTGDEAVEYALAAVDSP